MAATLNSDFRFEPRVWSQHAMAYFDRKLRYGAFALKNKELETEGTGLVINFPYYNTIGDAERIAEDESLTVDNLRDDSFSTPVFEIGKAVGVKKKAFKGTADSTKGISTEITRQLGRVHAELLDANLNDEITLYNGVAGGPVGLTENLYNNMVIGYLATQATHTMNVRDLLRSKIRAFGDKHDDAQVCFMHSLQWLDSQIDTTAGFLRADANDPLSGITGFTGRLFGMAIIVLDSCKKIDTQIGGKDAYLAHFHKMNSYGVIMKQDMEFSEDYDILAREKVYACNQWYGVKSFDRKISSLDNKAGGIITTVSENLARGA